MVEIIARLKLKDEQKNKDRASKSPQQSTPSTQPKASEPPSDLKPKRPPKAPPRKKPRNKRARIKPRPPFIAHFSCSQSVTQYVAINDFIDYRYDNGRYILCEINDRSRTNTDYQIL